MKRIIFIMIVLQSFVCTCLSAQTFFVKRGKLESPNIVTGQEIIRRSDIQDYWDITSFLIWRSNNVYSGEGVSVNSLLNTLERDFKRNREDAERIIKNLSGNMYRLFWLRNDNDQISDWIAIIRDDNW